MKLPVEYYSPKSFDEGFADIGEDLLHVALEGSCEQGQRVAREWQLGCKVRIWQGSAGMLVWVQGLSGEGVAGSRHARTIMWLKVVMIEG